MKSLIEHALGGDSGPNEAEAIKYVASFLCEDVIAFVQARRLAGHQCSDPKDERWGLTTELTLSDGGLVCVYERHADEPS